MSKFEQVGKGRNAKSSARQVPFPHKMLIWPQNLLDWWPWWWLSEARNCSQNARNTSVWSLFYMGGTRYMHLLRYLWRLQACNLWQVNKWQVNCNLTDGARGEIAVQAVVIWTCKFMYQPIANKLTQLSPTLTSPYEAILSQLTTSNKWRIFPLSWCSTTILYDIAASLP